MRIPVSLFNNWDLITTRSLPKPATALYGHDYSDSALSKNRVTYSTKCPNETIHRRNA
ncbi:unnamed protein product [Dovyalis caffra]|uniref:Uncharacterized protein n=1 Tax=Dovyalis caffra TaxID=77055 RepID=A0AAV1RK94_9ROSI|nr:unnamed protein product [Dovyalis caffra]